MKYLIVLLFLLLGWSSIFGQQSDSLKFTVIESMPSYNGQSADIGIRKYLKEHLIYPYFAVKNDIQGKVYVSFTVDANSWVKKQVTNIHVVKGVHPSLDYAAIKIIDNMPNVWKPGKARGAEDTVRFVVPVNFKMETISKKQISDCYDKEIEQLLKLDKAALDSVLYKDKPSDRELHSISVSSSRNNNNELLNERNFKISGLVFDGNDKTPLCGATVIEIGTLNATLTDLEGKFLLSVKQNKWIEIKVLCRGYQTQKIKLKRRRKIKVPEIYLLPESKE